MARKKAELKAKKAKFLYKSRKKNSLGHTNEIEEEQFLPIQIKFDFVVSPRVPKLVYGTYTQCVCVSAKSLHTNI